MQETSGRKARFIVPIPLTSKMTVLSNVSSPKELTITYLAPPPRRTGPGLYFWQAMSFLLMTAFPYTLLWVHPHKIQE